MSQIRKTVLEVVVLHDEDEAPDLSDLSLSVIAEGMDDGGFLGRMKVVSTEVVPAERLVDEEEALGGDGTFFGSDNEDDLDDDDD